VPLQGLSAADVDAAEGETPERQLPGITEELEVRVEERVSNAAY
jgi:hypothetical protein